jgi:hypothetical protein
MPWPTPVDPNSSRAVSASTIGLHFDAERLARTSRQLLKKLRFTLGAKADHLLRSDQLGHIHRRVTLTGRHKNDRPGAGRKPVLRHHNKPAAASVSNLYAGRG